MATVGCKRRVGTFVVIREIIVISAVSFRFVDTALECFNCRNLTFYLPHNPQYGSDNVRKTNNILKMARTVETKEWMDSLGKSYDDCTTGLRVMYLLENGKNIYRLKES